MPARLVEKPWGRETLPPPFGAQPGRRIGEIWFDPPPALNSLLVKYIFTSEKLSVQTHPTGEQAQARGLGPRGKDECWLIVSAEPGAAVGIGFDREMDEVELRRASLDGSIETMLTWHPVQPGDFFYIPANTVHAIGPGVGLIEIQQNSDLTYRLYDYGRPRELHLEEGVTIARAEPYPERLHRRVQPEGHVKLVDGAHFRVDRLDGEIPECVAQSYSGGPLVVVPLAGTLTVGGSEMGFCRCGFASTVDDIRVGADALCLLAQPTGR